MTKAHHIDIQIYCLPALPSLPQARDCIAEWRKDYNEVRPHSSLGRIPPSQFAQRQRIQIFATDSNNNQFLD
jgi:putative transposase